MIKCSNTRTKPNLNLSLGNCNNQTWLNLLKHYTELTILNHTDILNLVTSNYFYDNKDLAAFEVMGKALIKIYNHKRNVTSKTDLASCLIFSFRVLDLLILSLLCDIANNFYVSWFRTVHNWLWLTIELYAFSKYSLTSLLTSLTKHFPPQTHTPILCSFIYFLLFPLTFTRSLFHHSLLNNV